MNINMKKIPLFIILFGLVFILSACGSDTASEPVEPEPINVTVQSAADSLSVRRELVYPGMVVSESEATISAKASGNVTGLKIQVGDQVALGQELARIDDINSSFNPDNFNANQIKQAKLAVQQAESAYNLARDSYNRLLVSAVKDLQQAEIARDQALKGQSNLETTAAESLKSAELAYETAKIATEQARLTLENREKLAQQSVLDARTNADLTASSVTGTAGTIITNINNILALDDNNTVSISYRANLGALDASIFSVVKDSYQLAKSAYADYTKASFVNIEDRVESALAVATAVKKLADDSKLLLDKTITSANLPQTSISGVSLSGLQSTVSGYQAQINAAVGQMNATQQAFSGLDLNNSSLLDSLKQAYELAQQQEASAQQALKNLQAGNTSQKDQAGFAFNLAQNQYDNLKIKMETQIMSAKTQMESAKIQYDNASYTLQSLYDAHSVIAPLTGKITKIFVAEGESINPGQPIATVSQTDNIKVQLYVEADNLLDIKLGQAAVVLDNNDQSYNGVVSAVSPQADSVTRRFLVEVKLIDAPGLLLGTVATVKLNLVKTVDSAGSIILPLSAVTVGQSESYIYVVKEGRTEKIIVEIAEVIGELARVKVSVRPDTMIIIDGNKLVQDGTAVAAESID
jgi:RND family efflux transporter MFP subunit